jgi:predicted nucleotidyltransferase
MDQKDRTIILELKNRIPDNVKDHIYKIIAFGSRVRENGKDDSDLDLLILLDRKTPELLHIIEEIAYQVMWDYDFRPIISIKLFTEANFNKYLAEGFSFYKNIEREGIAL